MKIKLPIILLLFSAAISISDGFCQVRRFVKPSSSGHADGSSWENASSDLQGMIDAEGTEEVWVASGTYRPVRPFDNTSLYQPLDRKNAFVMCPNVRIYGGFAGIETTLDARNAASRSTLSGDMGEDDFVVDGVSETIRGANSYHVVISVNEVGSALLDGFIITGGNADSDAIINVDGWNVRSFEGGGFYVGKSSPTLSNLVVRSNHSNGLGGGGCVYWDSQANITRSSFLDNTTELSGGGLSIADSDVTLTHCEFRGNTAVRDNGGGIAVWSSGGRINNTLITGNTASHGGGMYFYHSSTEVANSTISGNTGLARGGIYSLGEPVAKFRNSIIWGNSDNATGGLPEFAYSLVSGIDLPGEGNFPGSTNPGFVSPALASLAPTKEGDYRLLATSPLLNAGTPDITGLGLTDLDLAGNAQVQDGRIDLGPYEGGVQPAEPIYEIRYVMQIARGTGDGSSWENASDDIQAMIEKQYVKQVWVAEGKYVPRCRADDVSTESVGDRNNAFLMKIDVKIYGGFKGTETSLSQRDLQSAGRSILSGDLDNNDITAGGLSTSNRGSNAYHVVVCIGNAGEAVLDGFTITSGTGNDNLTTLINGYAARRDEGGGLYIANSSPKINKVFIAGNVARTGGGIYLIWSKATISNFVVQRNTASNSGGGISINYDYPTLINGRITGNSASSFAGGGFYNYGHGVNVVNVVISGNSARTEGGGVLIANGQHTFTNTTIAGNRSTGLGGGIHTRSNALTLINSVVWGNSDGIASSEGGSALFSHCLVEGVGANAGPGNLTPTTNPLFKSAPSWSGAPFTGGDYNLSGCSPLINAGLSASNSYPTDAAGNFRIQLGSIDIGAYEAINTNPDQGAALAASSQSVQADQNSSGSTVYASGCELLIATVAGIGTEEPVRGNVTARVWVEATQPDGFVQRHYEIFSAENGGSAEGRVTLYFSQEEFNAFNATASKPLPANASDGAGKANLRIEKRGGQSQQGAPDATGLPNTYTGGIATIDPQDSDILWNAAYARWEISFNVKGFSGFFVKTQEGALPVELVSFQAVKEGNAAQLKWETAWEVNSETFVILRSADGKKWSEIGSVAAAQSSSAQLQYKFTDAAPLAGENLYKLKMIDADGTFAYSMLRSVRMPDHNRIIAFPNPINRFTRIDLVTPPVGGKVWLVNAAGQKLFEFLVKNTTVDIDLSRVASGTYLLTTSDGRAVKVVKQ